METKGSTDKNIDKPRSHKGTIYDELRAMIEARLEESAVSMGGEFNIDESASDVLISPERQKGIELAREEIINLVDNNEVAYVAIQYLIDSERTDLQSLLKDEEKRPQVIRELQKISERAYRSLLSSLIEDSTDINKIGGDQATVDALSERLIAIGCKLFDSTGFSSPGDPDYWHLEEDFINRRKNGIAEEWNVHDPDSDEDLDGARIILEQARSMEPELGRFLNDVVDNAKIGSKNFLNVSYRTKSLESLMNKISKFRKTEWGSDATIADAVDLLGGRVVVEDLASLEKIMLATEDLIKNNPKMNILRKENKFIANHNSPDPYRAIHYIIELPSEEGLLHTFELQLKTFSSMIASDMFHNAVYKPDILKLPGELQDTVREYNWSSDAEEMKGYLGIAEFLEIGEVPLEQKVQKTISDLDFNAFYDLVLKEMDPALPLSEYQKDLLSKLHQIESRKIEDLASISENLVLELASVAHNSYFEKAAKDMLENPNSDQLGNKLPEEAVMLLSKEAQNLYRNRYEAFNGKNNKISVEQLELHKLKDDDLIKFFEICGKNPDLQNTKISRLIDEIKSSRSATTEDVQKRSKLNIMNLYHAPFSDLYEMTQEESSSYIEDQQSREVWKNTLIQSQLKAIATSSILTEIGGFDNAGDYRDLSELAHAGSRNTLREMYTFMFFVSADRSSSEFADMSYFDFTTNPDTEWARDFDRAMDKAIMSKTISVQIDSIDNMIKSEENNIYLARLQKAKYELAKKYISSLGFERSITQSALEEIDGQSKIEISKLISGEDLIATIDRVKSGEDFNNLIVRLEAEFQQI